jgi:hypothetical protein
VAGAGETFHEATSVLIALEGQVVEVEGLGIRELEEDFGTGGLPSGAEAADFSRLENYDD